MGNLCKRSVVLPVLVIRQWSEADPDALRASVRALTEEQRRGRTTTSGVFVSQKSIASLRRASNVPPAATGLSKFLGDQETSIDAAILFSGG